MLKCAASNANAACFWSNLMGLVKNSTICLACHFFNKCSTIRQERPGLVGNECDYVGEGTVLKDMWKENTTDAPTYKKWYFPYFTYRMRDSFEFQRAEWCQILYLRPGHANNLNMSNNYSEAKWRA